MGHGVSEYKEIAVSLGEVGVLRPEEQALLVQMAGHRNRLVHFYHEIGEEELYQICTQGLQDVESVTAALKRWIRAHPERFDETL